MGNKIGFIGAGNMGIAIIRGLVSSGLIKPNHIYIYDRNQFKMDALHEALGVLPVANIGELTQKSDRIFIAVKPDAVAEMLTKMKPELTPHQIVISVAAGVTLAAMESVIGASSKIVRVMPNTPALVNAAMSSCTPNSAVLADELEEVLSLMRSIGRAEIVPESLIHAVVGVSGSAPAYIFILIEAMADAAVKAGMARKIAYEFAAQAVLGSAKMVLETGEHPGVLKDGVCSPGGTTIEAVTMLEEKGFRAAINAAINTCIEKSKRMSE